MQHTLHTTVQVVRALINEFSPQTSEIVTAKIQILPVAPRSALILATSFSAHGAQQIFSQVEPVKRNSAATAQRNGIVGTECKYLYRKS